MSAVPSYEKINYSLRTNKNIERKLLFSRLREISSAIPFGGHRYLGFGSLWFVDFILAHRELGVGHMWSLEVEPAGVLRANFNRPYKCIEVHEGLSTDFLNEVSPSGWERPLLAWLDYDGVLDSTVVADCEKIFQGCQSNTVYIVSVNAERDSYRPRVGNNNERQHAIDTLEKLVGSAVDRSVIKEGARDVGPSDFRAFLSRTVLTYMTEALRVSGRSEEGVPYTFIPLFDLSHVDGAAMCTIGGAVVAPKDLDVWESCFGISRDRLAAGDVILREHIDLKPITLREKIEIDRLLPDSRGSVAAAARALNIGLATEEIEKYVQWYSRVPVFSESFV